MDVFHADMRGQLVAIDAEKTRQLVCVVGAVLLEVFVEEDTNSIGAEPA